jgi:hypothetical protein
MAHWVILKRDSESDYLNLELATRIRHNSQQSITVYFSNEQITVLKAEKPGTYAHICAYLGIPE